jgi:hypothetical protein
MLWHFIQLCSVLMNPVLLEERFMQSQRTWSLQPLLSCFVLNSIFLAIFYVMARQVLAVLRQWVNPFLAPGAPSLPAEAQSAFAGLGQMLSETEQYLAPVVFGLGLVVTLVLWLVLKSQGRRLLVAPSEKPAAVPPATVAREEEGATKRQPQGPPPLVQEPSQSSPQTAVQMLAILQREGRLVDFLKEDLQPYRDDQIGAAVRSIHQGCQAALLEHLDLEPILGDVEGAEVTVPLNFDPKAIRLTGNVSGNPPFKGTLRHHGWRVLRVDLPHLIAPQGKGWILTPAEVEIGE